MVTSLVLAHLNKAQGLVQYLLQPWHGKQSCKLPLFACFKLLFQNVTETRELEGGMFLEPGTKAASFPNYFSHGVKGLSRVKPSPA